MQSPKFKFIADELSETFAVVLLEEEWKKRVRYQIRKQLVFDPIEYRDYNDNIGKIIRDIRVKVLKGSHQVHYSKRYLTEKSRGLCRQMTLVHPQDLLLLERLSRSLYFELKSKAPSKSAFFEPDDGNFKLSFQQSDIGYGSFASWKKFQKKVFGFSKENKFIVVTDVANFYDFINFNHLRNIISGLAKVREGVLDLLIYLLNRLTWLPDYMPLTHVGMPQIETSATRVLANAMLYEVDRVSEDSSVQNYARFMDDMDIGVGSIVDAKRIIRDIDLTLQSRQLRLNSSKTEILNQKAAFIFFCIVENSYLARAEELLSKYSTSPRGKALVKLSLRRTYEKWLQRAPSGGPGDDSVFLRSNGSKIHKYLLRLIYQADGDVSNSDLLWLIRNDPGMRATALMHLAVSGQPNQALERVCLIYKSGIFVDDASIVNMTGFLLHTRFKRTNKSLKLTRELVKLLEYDGQLGLWCAIHVSTRFSFPAEILSLLRRNSARISEDYWTGRSAGGVFARLAGNSVATKHYQSILKEINSASAFEVFEYLKSLATSGTLTGANVSYLKAQNPTFPQRIYFPKVLALLALAKNPSLATIYADAKMQHARAFSDPLYMRMGLK